jgi:hypothetical protein
MNIPHGYSVFDTAIPVQLFNLVVLFGVFSVPLYCGNGDKPEGVQYQREESRKASGIHAYNCTQLAVGRKGV